MIAKGCSRAIRGAVAAVIASAAAAAAATAAPARWLPPNAYQPVVALTYNGSKVGQLRGALGLAFAGA